MQKEINLLDDQFTVMLDKLRTPAKKPPEHDEIKRILEALLFAHQAPLSFAKMREVINAHTPCKPRLLRRLLDEMNEDYAKMGRSFKLTEIAGGFQLRTLPQFAPYIETLLHNKRGEKLSPASLEVLAIIAYRQPITRPKVESIRGVDCSGVIHSLLERGLIEVVGRLEAPGRPSLYGVTKEFLIHFGLRDLSELPQPASLQASESPAQELSQPDDHT